MTLPFSRRSALRGIVSAAAVAVIEPASALLPEQPLSVPSGPIEISVTAVTRRTVRITIQAIKDGNPVPLVNDGALLDRSSDSSIVRVRTLAGPRTVRAGDLRVTLSASPLGVRVVGARGELLQELSLVSDTASSALEFSTGSGLLLGLGQGGPQFDRRGESDSMVSGQGGYKLATHGARVPIQLLSIPAGDDCAPPKGRARFLLMFSSSTEESRQRSCLSTRTSQACLRCLHSGRSATSSRIAPSGRRKRLCRRP